MLAWQTNLKTLIQQRGDFWILKLNRLTPKGLSQERNNI